MKGILSLFKSCGNVPQPLRPNTETKTKTKRSLLKNNILGEKQKETKKLFFIKTTKAKRQRTVKGEVAEKLGQLQKNASAQNTGLKWITTLSHPKLRNLHTCWHMQRSGVQPNNLLSGVVRPDTNILMMVNRAVGEAYMTPEKVFFCYQNFLFFYLSHYGDTK